MHIAYISHMCAHMTDWFCFYLFYFLRWFSFTSILKYKKNDLACEIYNFIGSLS